jgi:hypothetical protein
MGVCRVRYSDWLRATFAVGLLGLLVPCQARHALSQTPDKANKSAAPDCVARDVRSRNFLVHTDLSDREANDLLEELEIMLRQVVAYWGRPVRGTIECYVVRDFDNFRPAAIALRGVSGIRTAGGVTLMGADAAGKCCAAKSVVYASARTEVVRHEAVHAYCHQTFGRIGPVWYSEGMAEMGHYWKEGDAAVDIGRREIKFLHENPPQSLAATLSTSQVSGDCWQNYASRWALCHFLVHDPNYSSRFLSLGRGILAGKDISFDKIYGATARELWFEYLFFLEHIDRGYRVDLCAWDWSRKFTPLRPGRSMTVTVKAGRGWQATGLAVSPGQEYELTATGNWRIANELNPVDINGDAEGRGRLVGVLMNDYQLGPEFDVGGHDSLRLTTGGNLYLRCRNAWNALASDTGRAAVTFKLKGKDSPPNK